jgi:CheY-like chemotaxis protein
VSHVLIVDDSPVDRMMAGGILQKVRDVTVSYAENGADAILQIQRRLPDAMVCDLQMPELDGLQLVAYIKQNFPLLPVILMTARGSEEIAAEALRLGAASYVPKALLGRQLADVVVRIIDSATADRNHSCLMNALADCQCRFNLHNDPGLIEPLVSHLQEMLRCLPLVDESERLRVGIAVKHAVLNGLYHGNLELGKDVQDVTSDDAARLVRERSADPLYAGRSLVVDARLSPESAEFRVHHEGPGFDAANLQAEFDAVSSSSHLMRGWILMRSIMDEVSITDGGRCQTLLKRAMPKSELVLDE